jgi:ribose-phosphate pyrophosphokinase
VPDERNEQEEQGEGVGSVREIVTKKRMMLFSGTAHLSLAEEISEHLGVALAPAQLSRFASGEFYFRPEISARGCDVFVIQSHADPVNEAIMEQLVMIDALKRASARRITAVVPYYGYSRQDKKALAREPISAKLVADLLSAAGADRVVSVDLHSGQIQGFFDVPFDHLTAMPLLADFLRDHLGLEDGREITVVAPDAGRVKVAERLRDRLDSEIAYISKRRSRLEPHKIEEMVVEGEIKGQTCVLIDDMIDTAGTVTVGAKALSERGAAEIYAAATHPVLSGKAVQRLEESPIKEVVVTNTLPIPGEKQSEKLTVLSIASLIASALQAVFEEESVSEIFHGENMP